MTPNLLSLSWISAPSATKVLAENFSPPLINVSVVSSAVGIPKLFSDVAVDEPKILKLLKLLLVPVPIRFLSTSN